MHRHYSRNHRRQGGGNPRLTHIGKVLRAVHLQIVNLGVIGLAYKTRRAAEIDCQSARLHSVDRKAMLLQPTRDSLYVLLGNAV